MTTTEALDFRQAMRRLYLIAITLIVFFGLVTVAMSLWNRSRIERLEEQVRHLQERR